MVDIEMCLGSVNFIVIEYSQVIFFFLSECEIMLF